MTAVAPAASHGLSPARVRFALLALALGGFGIGTTEFVAMGLLPNIAHDLLPALYAVSTEKANAQAGLLISAYALGVVVGAPTIAALSARFPRKQLLLVLLVGFIVATVASALLPSFGLVVLARFIAGLPHGAYFGVASLVAASLMGPGKRGAGIAYVLGGLTIANVVGVPVITLLGQSAGWRVAYLIVASIFVLTFIAVWLAVPLQSGDAAATIRRELGGFKRVQVWFALAIGAIGFGGFFAVYSYVAPIVTNVTHLPAAIVSLALVTIGLGMTVGNQLGGRFADIHVMRTLFAGFALLAASLLSFALTAHTVPGLFISLFFVGLSSATVSPAIQTRLMDVAGDSQTLAAAVNHSALNLGNSLGAYLGGLTIAAGLGYLSPSWTGLGLTLVGAAIAGASVWVAHRALQRSRRLSLHKNAVLDGALP
jgi:DHA1 family inner membrane transport protein